MEKESKTRIEVKNDAGDLAPHVYRYIRDMILSLQIKSGQKIPEASIVEQLGISRTPVREALRRLSNEGLVVIHPRRFSEVATFNDEDIVQLATVRISLDSLAVRLAIRNGSNADFIRLRKIIDECVEAEKSGDVNERIKRDLAFHIELSKIGLNKYLLNIQKSLVLKVHFFLMMKIDENPSTSLPDIQDHYRIMDALMERNETEAIKRLRNHMIGFYGIDKDGEAGFFEDSDSFI